MTIILFALLTVATYTWFDLSATPSVNDMSLYVNSGFGMKLSFDKNLDFEEWESQLDFRNIDLQMEETPLTPVTYSAAENCFYAASYNGDGRVAGINLRVEELPSERNVLNNNGHFLKVRFFAKSEENVKVSLSPAVEVEEGVIGAGTWLVGAPVWDSRSVSHTNGGGGAEYAMRVGINITKLNSRGSSTTGNSVFYIYEPNCDKHLDGSSGYVETQSVSGGAMIPAERHIRQSTSQWRDADVVQKNVVISQLGEFMEDPYLFDLNAGEMAQIDLYFWLEGQDVDCGNLLIQRSMIMSNIQFTAEAEGGSDLVPIW